MNSANQQGGIRAGKRPLRLFFGAGVAITALGVFVPQHDAVLDSGGIERLSGTVLAIGAVISLLVS